MKKVFNWYAKQGIYVDEHGLTPYHFMRNKRAAKAIEEMMKHPLTPEQMKIQIAKRKNQKSD